MTLSSCKHLVIELALFNKKKKAYDIVQANSVVTEEQICESIISPECFFFGASDISFERKKLLSVVYNKVVKAILKQDISVKNYSMSLSYVYFCFQTENEEIVFSTPHTTSSIIFNPNDLHGTYTLDHNRPGRHINLVKRIPSRVAVFDYENGTDIMTKRFVDNTILGQVSCWEIVNSLFDYYNMYESIKVGYQGQTRSVYADKTETTCDISIISTFQTRNFRYINDTH